MIRQSPYSPRLPHPLEIALIAGCKPRSGGRHFHEPSFQIGRCYLPGLSCALGLASTVSDILGSISFVLLMRGSSHLPSWLKKIITGMR